MGGGQLGMAASGPVLRNRAVRGWRTPWERSTRDRPTTTASVAALVSLESAQDEARAAFTSAFERLEHKASGRLEKIVGNTQDEATSVTKALRKVLAESHEALLGLRDRAVAQCAAAAQQIEENAAQREAAIASVAAEATDRIKASRRAVQDHADRFERALGEAEQHRAAIERARVTVETAATDVEVRAEEQLNGIEQRGEATLARVETALQTALRTRRGRTRRAAKQSSTRVSAESRERIKTSRRVVEEQAQQFESLLAEAATHGVAVEDARAAVETAAREIESRADEQLTELDRRSEEALAQLDANVAELSWRREEALGRIDANVAELGRRGEQSLTQVETALAEIEQRFAEDARRREDAVARLSADAAERLEASQRAVGDQVAQIEAILAEIAGQRAAVDEARATIERAVHDVTSRADEELAELRRRGEQKHSELEAAVVDFRDAAVARSAAAAQRVEDESVHRQAMLEQSAAESTERIVASARAVEDQTRELGAQASQHVAELLVGVDADTKALQELARTRMDEALGAVDEQLRAVMEATVGRSRDLVASTEVDRDAVHAQRDEAHRLVASITDRAEHAATAAQGADAALETIRLHSATAGRLVEELIADAEVARQAWASALAPTEEALVPESQPEPEFEHADAPWEVAPTPDLPVVEWQAVTDEPASPVAPEVPVDDAPSRDQPADDAFLQPPPVPHDDNFFRQIAAELREDPAWRELPRPDDGYGLPAPSVAPATDGVAPPQSPAVEPSILLGTITAESPLPAPVEEPEVDRPATLIVSIAPLIACVQQLGSGNADRPVRIELSPLASKKHGSAHLRLTTYDPSGWWECHELAATTDPHVSASAVVDMGELREALGVLSRFGSESEAYMVFDGDVTIGNNLLIAHDPATIPVLSDERVRVESIDLNDADRAGLALETQAGRLFVPPALMTQLKRRQTTTAELVTIDGMPCLVAPVHAASDTSSATLVGQLQELGEHDVPEVPERRNTRGEAVAHLVSALSAATTAEELERILKVGVGYVRRKAAAHPALPPTVIEDLLREGTEAMRAAAAANPSISDGAAELAVTDSSETVRATIASNPTLTGDALAALADDDSPVVRERVATNPTVTTELLDQLAADPEPLVRAAAARHERLNPETLLELARDPDERVCSAVAANPSCPAETLNDLAGVVPEAVLGNPHVSPWLLVAGSLVDAPRLREQVAANPATPAKQLRKLAKDEDFGVLKAVVQHPQTPASARRRARRQLDGSRRDARPKSS